MNVTHIWCHMALYICKEKKQLYGLSLWGDATNGHMVQRFFSQPPLPPLIQLKWNTRVLILYSMGVLRKNLRKNAATAEVIALHIKTQRLRGQAYISHSLIYNLWLQLAAAPNTQQGLPIASAFPVTMFLLQGGKVLLTDNQNMPFLKFIRSSIQKIKNQTFCLVGCEDLQAQPTIISGKR